MTLRIEKTSEGPTTVYKVSGRIGAENLPGLQAELAGKGAGASLDLEHVTLVDVDGVQFLSACEGNGMQLRHCSLYIREWIDRERKATAKKADQSNGR
jgi:hypothetical protein